MARFFTPYGTVQSWYGKIGIIVFLAGTLIILGLPMLVLHKPLRLLGRNGFYFNQQIVLGWKSFQKINAAQ